MRIAYEGYTLEGRSVAGVIAVEARDDARRALREQGIVATRIGGAEERGAGPSRLPLATRSVLFRQLALLLSTGTPLADALAGIERQTADRRVATVVGELRRRVEEGSALSEAFAAMPSVFDPICRTMCAAGEASGRLDRMLADLADAARRESTTRRAVVGALAYPLVTVLASLVVLVGLVVGVVPRFRAMFEAIQAPIPPLTAALMAIGEAIASNRLLSVGVAALLVVGAALAARSSTVRAWLVARLLDAPVVGRIMRDLATARLLRGLGLLLEAKVTLLDALHLVGESMSHPAYAALLDSAREDISEGEQLAVALARDGLVDASICQAIASGERSGQLGVVLSQLAKHLDEDNEIAVRSIARTLEPAVLACLGVVIGLLAIGLFLPLFDVAASAGGGG